MERQIQFKVTVTLENDDEVSEIADADMPEISDAIQKVITNALADEDGETLHVRAIEVERWC